MRNDSGEKRFTVLFVCDNPEKAKEELLAAFSGARTESAFYPNRYALHIPTGGMDENRIKLDVYEKWRELDVDAKILYMAPVFYNDSRADKLCDDNYDNPIEAFEAGYFYALENGK